MSSFTYRRRYRAFPRRRSSRARALARCAAAALGAALVCSILVARAGAGAGSGSARIVPPDTVQAGAAGTWSFPYVAAEDFQLPGGGTIDIVIPLAWTAPQLTDPGAPGYVGWSNPRVDSVATSGHTIHVHAGGLVPVLAGDTLVVAYGAGGGPASAIAQTMAPGTVVFLVDSPPLSRGPPPQTQGSPMRSVVAGP